jgi:hypothetical protein
MITKIIPEERDPKTGPSVKGGSWSNARECIMKSLSHTHNHTHTHKVGFTCIVHGIGYWKIPQDQSSREVLEYDYEVYIGLLGKLID